MTKTADELRDEAKAADKRAYDSFERCDTDGFMSQWASGITASKLRLEADLVEAGGTHSFRGLFDENGTRIKAKRVKGHDYFGNPETKWIVLDEHDSVLHWVNIPKNPDDPSGRSKMGKLGLHEEWEDGIPAKATTSGESITSVRAIVVRTDGGYPDDAVVYEGSLS